MTDENRTPGWVTGSYLIAAVVAVLYGCSQDGHHKQSVDELRSQAANAEAEALRANERADTMENQISDLEGRVEDLEGRLGE